MLYRTKATKKQCWLLLTSHFSAQNMNLWAFWYCCCNFMPPPKKSVRILHWGFFKQTVGIPFLDHLISDVSFTFAAHMKQAASLQRIIPLLITTNLFHIDISEGVDFYSDDLPNAAIVNKELSRWKSWWLAIPEKGRPQPLSAALKQCSPDTFQISSHYWSC